MVKQLEISICLHFKHNIKFTMIYIYIYTVYIFIPLNFWYDSMYVLLWCVYRPQTSCSVEVCLFCINAS